jgi:cobalt/nickel transport system permease protein
VTHLHVADGVLPWWAVLASLVLAACAVAGSLGTRKGVESVRFLARVGVTAAALLVAMSLPLGPGLHLSLAPLAGMMLGGRGGFLAAFLANAVLATLGHGGVTAVGVNGLFLGLQAALGAGLFSLLRRPLGVKGGAVTSTAVTLALAAATAIAALRALPLDPGDHHGEGKLEGLALTVVAVLATALAAAETAITASVIVFLSRVRSDLVHGGGAPRPRTSGEPA